MTPTSSPDPRFDAEDDEIAEQFFSSEDLLLSPEEYVARHAHGWGCFSFHFYRYRNAALGAWVRRVGQLLFDAVEIERCRERFLSPKERTKVRQEEAEGL
ncbi:MAG: hypothetical protein K2W96_03910 [Gemmataceae bacterium]|nr:hypothetical protein [Gemmataceae bacterium]